MTWSVYNCWNGRLESPMRNFRTCHTSHGRHLVSPVRFSQPIRVHRWTLRCSVFPEVEIVALQSQYLAPRVSTGVSRGFSCGHDLTRAPGNQKRLDSCRKGNVDRLPSAEGNVNKVECSLKVR